MNFGSVAVAYKERRFIKPHLEHLPDWIEDKAVLNSAFPWSGAEARDDQTGYGATLADTKKQVIQGTWDSETDQRNFGQAYHSNKDWVIVLDPDEFLSNEDWDKLKLFLESTDADAVVCEGQYTYWKDGWVADPPKDYQMLIAVRPQVKFVDKRVVGTGYVTAPVWVHHFSWARTDKEVWQKISNYSHNEDFDIKNWYDNVWKKWKPGDKDVHPVTPDTLHDFKKAKLPKEIGQLNLWP